MAPGVNDSGIARCKYSLWNVLQMYVPLGVINPSIPIALVSRLQEILAPQCLFALFLCVQILSALNFVDLMILLCFPKSFIPFLSPVIKRVYTTLVTYEKKKCEQRFVLCIAKFSVILTNRHHNKTQKVYIQNSICST